MAKLEKAVAELAARKKELEDQSKVTPTQTNK